MKDKILAWIDVDWKSHPGRMAIEIVAWCISVGCAIIMALTLPNPPFAIMYPIWITGSSMFAWAAWSRGSFGMLANYAVLVSIDLIALARLILLT